MTAAQQRRKAGRQVVSFLMVVNLTLWVSTILHTSQVTASQGEGDWLWMLLLHISLPLCILYRLDITVTNTVPVHGEMVTLVQVPVCSCPVRDMEQVLPVRPGPGASGLHLMPALPLPPYIATIYHSNHSSM